MGLWTEIKILESSKTSRWMIVMGLKKLLWVYLFRFVSSEMVEPSGGSKCLKFEIYIKFD